MTYLEKIDSIVAQIKKTCGTAEIAIILGSGLGDYAEKMQNAKKINYSEIKGFPQSTVVGHAGVWHTGDLFGKKVIMMQGRFHAYEGYPLEEIALPIRVMKKLGVKTIIVTNAAGGVNTSFNPGTLMMITDYINYSGMNPLVGHNYDEFGPRFPDMSYAFDRNLQNIAREAAKENGTNLKEGVYCWFSGPTYETPAEIRMARVFGADAVGMSTVPEVIVANHAGIKCLGISCITNLAAGILDQPLNHKEVMEIGKRVQAEFSGLVDKIIEKL
ncbi:MAG: purine-nucleoside phosphorylase [Eubacteriales bacterium]|nr:purine-nucleoside phosphorylase [Eubacteriales bacterium]